MLRQQAIAQCVAVEIERDRAVGHIDMAAGERLGGDDPLGVEAGQRRRVEEGSGEDVTGAAPEEDAVGQVPAPLRVALDAGLQPVRAPACPAAARNSARGSR